MREYGLIDATTRAISSMAKSQGYGSLFIPFIGIPSRSTAHQSPRPQPSRLGSGACSMNLVAFLSLHLMHLRGRILGGDHNGALCKCLAFSLPISTQQVSSVLLSETNLLARVCNRHGTRDSSQGEPCPSQRPAFYILLRKMKRGFRHPVSVVHCKSIILFNPSTAPPAWSSSAWPANQSQNRRYALFCLCSPAVLWLDRDVQGVTRSELGPVLRGLNRSLQPKTSSPALQRSEYGM